MGRPGRRAVAQAGGDINSPGPAPAPGGGHGGSPPSTSSPGADSDFPRAEPSLAGGEALLVVGHAAKSFGSVQALVDASIELYAGEAHGLVGENGAGKSTLVKVLAGVYRPDSGRVLLDGDEVRLAGPADARAAGIAVIYQEPTLFPDLSVAENIFMGRQPLSRGRRIDTRELRRRVKALSFQARVIVMDEPTAALSGAEVERLFSVARALRAQGTAVLFISHRLDEIFALCQRVTVMRDGRQVFTGPLDGLTRDDLVRRMVGRELSAMFPKQAATRGDVALSGRRR